jgi:hypothetical protein
MERYLANRSAEEGSPVSAGRRIFSYKAEREFVEVEFFASLRINSQ